VVVGGGGATRASRRDATEGAGPKTEKLRN